MLLDSSALLSTEERQTDRQTETEGKERETETESCNDKAEQNNYHSALNLFESKYERERVGEGGMEREKGRKGRRERGGGGRERERERQRQREEEGGEEEEEEEVTDCCGIVLRFWEIYNRATSEEEDEQKKQNYSRAEKQGLLPSLHKQHTGSSQSVRPS